MRYDQLSHVQKRIVKYLEKIYLEHPSITKKDYITSLAFLLNKHKKKKK